MNHRPRSRVGDVFANDGALARGTQAHLNTMHFRFLATCDRDTAETSEEARAYVLDTLLEEGFVGEGRWGGGLCDWFVIGGRWSGELSRRSWAREITARMAALEEQHGVQVWGTF